MPQQCLCVPVLQRWYVFMNVLANSCWQLRVAWRGKFSRHLKLKGHDLIESPVGKIGATEKARPVGSSDLKGTLACC